MSLDAGVLSLAQVGFERTDKQLVNRIVLQKMLQQALQVNNPSKEWFAKIIRQQMGILAEIAKKQQEQGIDIPPEVRAILDPRALMKSGGSCLKVSKGGKGKAPRGLVDPSCVAEGQTFYNKHDNQVYFLSKAGGRKKWERIAVDESMRTVFKDQWAKRGGVALAESKVEDVK